MNKAVITADVIHSTRMSNDDKLWLYKAIKDVLKNIDQDFNAKSETYRGDSFQCLVQNPKDALRIALIIRTFIRSLNPSVSRHVSSKGNFESKKEILFPVWIFDVRMVIGIGDVDFSMNKIGTSDGEAFQLSGRQLDELKNSRQRFSILSNDFRSKELQLESAMLDYIITKATALQCEVVNYKLLDYTENEIARYLNINQAAVNQRSVSGGWNVINKMVEYFEDIYENG